jgi:predicted Zn-dependent protease
MRHSATVLLLAILATVCAASSGAAQSKDFGRQRPAPAPAQRAELAVQSQAASRAMGERRFDDAAAIYRDLLRALPNEAGLLMNLGMALAMGGHEADAIEPLRQAIALKPDLIPAHLFLGSSYLALGRASDAIPPLKHVVTARASDVESRRMLAQAYVASGRPSDAVTQLRSITALAPQLPAGWYALGHAYNAITQDAIDAFNDQPDDSPWRQLLLADALFADGRLTDAFALYKSASERLTDIVSIHDSIARIYEQTGHAEWARVEKTKGALPPGACARRQALCAFRAAQYRAALAAASAGHDPESLYWRARAATELALAAFKRLDELADSRERREMRAAIALSVRKCSDAMAELQAALKFAPADPALLDDLGTAYYSAREFDKAVETLSPLLQASPDDPRLLALLGDSLFQLQRVDEALPLLRHAIERDPDDPMPRLALGRAYLQKGEFAAAVPLLASEVERDQDGSLHVQLARAYTGLGESEKAAALLERSQELQRAAQQRAAAIGQRTITPPK